MNDCIDHGLKGNAKGYAAKTTRADGRKSSTSLHRWVYCQHNEVTLKAIEGFVVRHKCDNPRCINPAHLEIGTVQDNVDDRVSRGRGAIRANQGRAVLTEEQVSEIRRRYKPGCRINGTAALAREFNVSQAQMYRVCKQKQWRETNAK